MSEISSINTSIQSQVLGSTVSKTDMAKSDFLKLLITELKNQDPMSPMDSQDFAAQLAQFSSLEQLQNIDSNLEQGVELDLILTQAINNTLAATIIGKNAKAIGNSIELGESGTVDLSFKLGGFANEVKVTVMDSSGNEVKVISAKDLSQGEHVLNWDGKNQDGRAVIDGNYSFRVEAIDVDGNEVYSSPLISGKVTGVRYEQGRAVLMINDVQVPFSAVLEIGESDNS